MKGAQLPREDPKAALREEAARIESLLAEVERTAGPATWAKLEELIHRLVALYGAGLEHVLGCAREAGALTKELEQALCADELVSHLLILHGLHPVPIAARLERALDEVRPYLRSHAGGVELLGIDRDGVAHLELEGTCRGCPSSQATIEHTLRRAIEEAAPELGGVEVETGTASDGQRLIELRVEPRSAGWKTVALPVLGAGARHLSELDGTRVLFLRVGDGLFAYRDRCRCGAPLAGAPLDDALLSCTACGGRFDVVHGGRGIDRPGGLCPVPLLSDAAGVRIALPGGEA